MRWTWLKGGLSWMGEVDMVEGGLSWMGEVDMVEGGAVMDG